MSAEPGFASGHESVGGSLRAQPLKLLAIVIEVRVSPHGMFHAWARWDWGLVQFQSCSGSSVVPPDTLTMNIIKETLKSNSAAEAAKFDFLHIVRLACLIF